MIEKFYTCELLADIVLNSSLATEGNMQSLDYIAGSNFYGIVAAAVYADNGIKSDEKKRLLHSEQVSFGDAMISDGDSVFYSMPFAYYKEKDKSDAPIVLHHQIVDLKDGIQYKQERSGYLNAYGQLIKKVKKNFQLKSAYDRNNRTSDEGKMFGFEAIEAGQKFIFSVIYQDDSDIKTIENHLLGEKYIGKSKTAQYGKVKISELKTINSISSFEAKDVALVYAESHLCFFTANGLPTYEPTIQDLGFESGEIIWKKSQIRTFVYSPWNGKRATNTMQRNCIAKGSVFYIQNPQKKTGFPRSVGEYINEGLGRILINPVFLKNNGNKLNISLTEMNLEKKKETTIANSDSILFKRLQLIKNQKQASIAIAQKVNETLAKLKSENNSLLKITSSQWGAIRALANKASNYEDLDKKLFDLQTGYLEKGVAYERYWGKNNNIQKLKTIIKNQELTFIIKLVSEIAKVINAKDKKQINE